MTTETTPPFSHLFGDVPTVRVRITGAAVTYSPTITGSALTLVHGETYAVPQAEADWMISDELAEPIG